MPTLRALFALLVISLPGVSAMAAEPGDYLAFIRAQAESLRKNDKPPVSKDDWQKQNELLRQNLLAAWGGFPEQPCPLDPQFHGESLKRDGYRVEKLTIQTRPGVRMTANAYVPDKSGKSPAILQVHGHWKGAKQDPTVQARCIGAVKHGFFVLCVDAFGSGERAIGTALGEYHGDMTGATLLPVGLPLSGLQVYENMRAVDYLRTRPEVDGTKIGITGASGGGNQTMYAGAWDTRFSAAVPVCSVGNYQAYLGAACCMCEVVPGALRFTEEAGVLSLTAPRGLMVINATRDGRQFSVPEAKKSIAAAEPVFKLFDKPTNLRHTIFESPHDYNKAMREAMYGWMTLHLKGIGDGSAIPEPEIKTENPEDLRCFPGDSRPKDWITIPRFAAAEGKKLLAAKVEPKTAEEWKAWKEKTRPALAKSLGGFPEGKSDTKWKEGFEDTSVFEITTEPGIRLPLVFRFDAKKPKGSQPIALILSLQKSDRTMEFHKAAINAGWATLDLELRATGRDVVPGDKVGRAPDHTSAEWGLWIGRPLLGQWVHDIRQTLSHFGPENDKDGKPIPREVIVIGDGPAGVVALCAAALDSRITKVVAVESLASFVTEVPYVNQRLGLLTPGILRDVGDIGHIAAMVAPRNVVIAGGVLSNGEKISKTEFAIHYKPASEAFRQLGGSLVVSGTEPESVVNALK